MADKKVTECVLVGAEGEYKTHLSLPFTPKTRDRDAQELRTFIETHKPSVVAVGAHGYASRHLYADVMAILGEMERDGFVVPLASWVDAEVPEIYWSTAEARTEFRQLQQLTQFGASAGDKASGRKAHSGQTYNAQLARALSLGRFLLEPLVESARLCNAKRDICCLSLHALQELVPSDALYTRLERTFVMIVNAVGVDFNLVLREPRLAPLLGFVAGLGPRKAAHLLAEARANATVISSRAQLMKYFGGEIVARNAIGFIKLDRGVLKTRALHHQHQQHQQQQQQQQAEGSQGEVENQAGCEWFDMTRIHPDDYGFASKIAKDAIERDDCENFVEEVMRAPDELERIDLDMFAQLLEQNFGQRKLHTLYDIKQELTAPFSDPRESYQDMDTDRLFDLLTGTTEETLYLGMFVKCRIVMKKGTLLLLLLYLVYYSALFIFYFYFSYYFY
jgi:transcription elongation factor SPT6